VQKIRNEHIAKKLVEPTLAGRAILIKNPVRETTMIIAGQGAFAGGSRLGGVRFVRVREGVAGPNHFIKKPLEISQTRAGNDDGGMPGTCNLADTQEPAAVVFLEREGEAFSFHLERFFLQRVFHHMGTREGRFAGMKTMFLRRLIAVGPRMLAGVHLKFNLPKCRAGKRKIFGSVVNGWAGPARRECPSQFKSGHGRFNSLIAAGEKPC